MINHAYAKQLWPTVEPANYSLKGTLHPKWASLSSPCERMKNVLVRQNDVSRRVGKKRSCIRPASQVNNMKSRIKMLFAGSCASCRLALTGLNTYSASSARGLRLPGQSTRCLFKTRP